MRFFIFFIAVKIFAYTFMAKVEPYEIYNIKSSVSGSVVFVNKELESKNVKNKLLVKIDDIKDKINFQNIKQQIKLLNQEIINQQQVVKRKKELYLKYKKLKTKSIEQKNQKFYDYINAYNQLLNLKNQLANLVAQKKSLEDTINKKNIKVSGYVYKIYVNKGDFVNPGSLIAKIEDISKQKLTIYVPLSLKKVIKTKNIFINDKKSNFKVNKIFNDTDEKYVTSYKVELVGSGLNLGEVVKIEIK